MIPKKTIVNIATASEEDKNILGHLMWVCAETSRRRIAEDGYRLVTNVNKLGGNLSIIYTYIYSGKDRCSRLSRMTILVTGFSSFPGVPINPCGEVLTWIEKTYPCEDVAICLLPVSFSRSAQILADCIQKLSPDAVIKIRSIQSNCCG